MWPVVLLSVILATGAFLSISARKLTPAGALSGVLIGVLLYAGAGFTGVAMMAVFFVMAVAATRWKSEIKKPLRQDDEKNGLRNAGQVWANGGAAAMFAWVALITGDEHAVLLLAACFASANGDTLSSEVGMVYGKRFYNITNLQPDVKGKDGVISMEGTLAGIAGSLVIAMVYATGFGLDLSVLIIVVAGLAGNLFDSLLGATAERKGIMHNDVVNFLNTLFAAAFAEGLYILFTHVIH